MIDFVPFMEAVNFKDIVPEKIEEYWQSDQWGLEPTEKGRRYQFRTDDFSFSSRSQEPLNTQKIQHIFDELQTLPTGCLFDGILTSGNYNETIQILEFPLQKCLEVQERKPLYFVLTDILFCNDEDICTLPLFDRRNILTSMIREFKYSRASNIYSDKKQEMYDSLKIVYDSFYFKDLESQYSFNKSRRWRLYKEPQIFFAVVTDVIVDTGKFENMAGTLQISNYINGKLKKITNIGGMSTDDRITFFNDKEKIIGKVVEFKAQQKTNSTYSEARFVGIREDIDPQSCIF